MRVASWRCCVFLLKRKNHTPQAQSTAAQEVMHHMFQEGRKLRIINGGLKKQFAGSKAQIKILKLLCVFSLQRKEAIIILSGVQRQGRGYQHATPGVQQYVHIYTVRIQSSWLLTNVTDTDQMNLLKSERKETKLSVRH